MFAIAKHWYNKTVRKTQPEPIGVVIKGAKYDKQKQLVENTRVKFLPLVINYEWRKRAIMFWVCHAQEQFFGKEIECLQRGQPLQRGSKLLPLAPFLSEEKFSNTKVLRVGGRIAANSETGGQFHPIILPKEHVFSRLIVEHQHLELCHAPIDTTHFRIRTTYYILSSRQLIRSVIHKCSQCQRFNNRRHHQIMSLLPKFRVQFTAPFEVTGMDFFGPLKIKKTAATNQTVNSYVLAFTCMSTRAVHLEPTFGRSAEDVLQAFTRFACTKGFPSHLLQDNALEFEATERALKKLIEESNEKLRENEEKFNMKFSYIAPYAAHSAGVWERVVKMARHPLEKVLKNAKVTFPELLSILKLIEAQLQDRPLARASEETLEVITPSMLLLGRKIRPFITSFDDTIKPTTTCVRERWRYRNTLAQQFFHAWVSTYRTSLFQRSKWHTEKPSLKPGQIVSLYEETKKRGDFQRVVITKVEPSRDGLAHSVQVTPGPNYRKIRGVWNVVDPGDVETRTVHQLIPLEFEDGPNVLSESDKQDAPSAPSSPEPPLKI